ncbi:MAG: hypothetical protein ACPLW7_01260 [Minisyncoccia bacterium]
MINLFNFSKNNKIVICYNELSCVDCFKNLVLEIYSKFGGFEIYFLIRTNNNSSENKRISIQSLKRKLNLKWNKIKIFFDRHFDEDPWPPINLKEGIFGKYNISKTPAYFIISPDTIIFKNYDEIVKELYR